MSQYILILKKGDLLAKNLLEFCSKNNITSAWVSGIGAISEVSLAFYHLDQKTFSKKKIKKELEVASLGGNIGLLDGKIVSHLHIVLSDKEMHTFGGHLDEAIVAATCELSIVSLPSQIIRRHSQEIGLNLIGNVTSVTTIK